MTSADAESTIRYRGRVFEGKENHGIESHEGKNSVSLGMPCDFIDKQLAEFKGKEVEVEITIKISQK